LGAANRRCPLSSKPVTNGIRCPCSVALQMSLYNFSQAACFAPLYDLPRPSRQHDAEAIPTTDSSDLRPSCPSRAYRGTRLRG
jgi:hypothetical protein